LARGEPSKGAKKFSRAGRAVVWSAIVLAAFLLGGVLVAEGIVPVRLDSLNFNSLVSNPLSSTAPGPAQTTTVAVGPLSISDTVAQASPAVVNINTTIETKVQVDPFFDDPFFREFFGNQRARPQTQVNHGIGTGFIINPDGYIVTNEHVVETASSIEVTVSGVDKPLPARVVGSDHELDLAVIKIDAGKSLPTLSLGDSGSLRPGDWVIAIGNPYGLDHTVTSGVVSALGRPVPIEDRVYSNLIQTDAAINPGNSGGPLLNLQGQVVGINTAVNAQAQGIGFAIPVNTAKEALDDLISKGRISRPWVGVSAQAITPDIASYFKLPDLHGVVIIDIEAGSPAARAKLQAKDIVRKIDDQPIQGMDDFTGAIKGHQVGDQVRLEVIRNGQTMEIAVELGEQP
jgi:Do/DeqQ family serine protease